MTKSSDEICDLAQCCLQYSHSTAVTYLNSILPVTSVTIYCLTLPSKDYNLIGRIFCIGCYLGIFSRCLYCVIVFHFTISMCSLRTLHPMLHCICMYVDVMVCVCQT